MLEGSEPQISYLAWGRCPDLLQDSKKRLLPLDMTLLTAVICFAVPQPPTITKQSVKDYIVDPRDNIFIECEAKGNPVPT